MTDRDPLYIGYAERAPASVTRFLRARVLAGLVVAVGLGAVLAAAQGGFVPSLFEFGNEREFVGWIREKPFPALLVPRPGNAEHCAPVSTYSLVALGKWGAGADVSGLDGQHARVRGTLIHLGERTLIELATDGVEAISGSGAPGVQRESLGTHTLDGEIVDSKCYFGVMNPGTGKVHRACAARCLSGGMPPVFRVQDGTGASITLLLVDVEGRAVNDRVLDRVAEPLRIRGQVERHDSLLVLRADPRSYERRTP